MLKTCTYCGKIHDKSQMCDQHKLAIAKRQKKIKNDKDDIRSSYRWTNKSKVIRRRDKNLCLCCLYDVGDLDKRWMTYRLQVHHIVPLEEDKSLAFEDSNLITLCPVHHEQAEAGDISRQELKRLVRLSSEEGESVDVL